jgi:hypothetical protein
MTTSSHFKVKAVIKSEMGNATKDKSTISAPPRKAKKAKKVVFSFVCRAKRCKKCGRGDIFN